MNRPILLMVAGLSIVAGSCATPRQAGPPHVLLVTIDTLRPDYLSFNGYDRKTSPFLDELLASGLYFERAVSPIGRTTPALASLLTGTYPHRSGVRTLAGRLADGVTTLAEVFRGHRYQTLAVVTNHVLGPERGLDRGFEIYDFAENARTDAATTAAALTHLARLDAARPVFAWVHFMDPHMPYHPEAGVAEAFDPGYTGRFRLNFGYEPRSDEPPELLSRPEGLTLRDTTLANRLPAAVNAHVRRLYAGDIRQTDDALRALIHGVRARLGERLVVVLTADHGESLGEHGYYYDHGDYVYNPDTLVPLGLLLPEDHPLHGAGRSTERVSLVDVAPTLFDLLDLDPGSHADRIEGRSLLPCLRREPLAPAPIFAESGDSWFPELVPRLVRNDVEGRFRAAILEHWKLVWTPFREGDDAWELYHLLDDPQETHNRYRADHPAVPALRAALDGWMARAGPPIEPPPLTETDRQRLRSLGYIE